MNQVTGKGSSVAKHYHHGSLLQAIEEALKKSGKSKDSATMEDLGPVDEFHVGGRVATASFMSQLNFGGGDRILDVGCGLGGAARFAADRYNVRVSGIDLTPEYIETGNTLCRWADLHNKVDLKQGSALSLPWDDSSFDGGYMLHVGMNIEEKEELFSEISRVLVSGATFGIYDIMRMSDDEPAYPVPWASDIRTSHLETPDQYRAALTGAGFSVSSEKNRREFALDFFKALKGKMEAEGGPPPLGLHTLMQSTTPVKIQNMIECISAGIAAPVELIARKN